MCVQFTVWLTSHIWSCTSIDSKYILKPPLIEELLDHPIPKAAAHHHSNCLRIHQVLPPFIPQNRSDSFQLSCHHSISDHAPQQEYPLNQLEQGVHQTKRSKSSPSHLEGGLWVSHSPVKNT